jgi:olefin beta-lactone synthetase
VVNRRPGAPDAVPGVDHLQRWGVDPEWSRHVEVPGHDGVTRRWHVLETEPGPTAHAAPTVVCVHGNPTWSVMWTSFLVRLGGAYRVVAPDLLGMGYSDRTAAPRTYAQRVGDLDDLLAALEVDGPVVLVAHDWGGAIAMGWAVAHPERVVALVLANTGIAVPEGRKAPTVIRLAATRGVHDLVTRRTPLFVRGTGWLSRGRLGRSERAALAAPYRRAVDRRAVGDFVADIPFTPSHPSAGAIDAVADTLSDLDVPVLLVWGGRDPVFDDDFAADLLDRFRHADLHRIGGAGHLVVPESATGHLPGPSVAEVAATWLNDRLTRPSDPRPLAQTTRPAEIDTESPHAAPTGRDRHRVADGRAHGDADPSWRPAWAAIDERSDDAAVAFHDGVSGRSITFAELHRMVAGIATGLAGRGVERGDRIALLVQPSPELVALVYACWRIGAVTVIADRGLGLRGLGRAVRSARVDAVIGPKPALMAARTMRWAPSAAPIDLVDIVAMADTGSTAARAATGAAGETGETGETDETATGRAHSAASSALPEGPSPDDEAAVLFTSGATGPAKGVRYTHARLAGQRDALIERYGIGPHDRFVAAFAPFALYGPALGITSAVPDVDVTTPGSLTADVLDRACAAIDATMVFASPAALANVVRTASAPLPALAKVRTVMSAGAPVPVRTLRAMSALAPAASLYTPYGMTEVLPVADIELNEIERSIADATGPTRGVCVGHPVPGCDVVIAPLAPPDASTHTIPVLQAVDEPGTTGEVMVRAAWMSAGYDGLWLTERSARPVDAAGCEWHRSGDVGHLDHEGRLWIEGRSVHLVHTADGPLTPVPVEVAVEALDGVGRAAAVGVGPVGVQQLVVVVEPEAAPSPTSETSGPGRRLSDRVTNGVKHITRRDTASDGLADLELAAQVRTALAPTPVAAVCVRAALPVDIRHNAKIDRTELAAWAEQLLSGSG